MPLPSPTWTTVTFRQLLEEARERIARTSPEWTDLAPTIRAWCCSRCSRT